MNIMLLETEGAPELVLAMWDNEGEGFGREIGIRFTIQELIDLEKYISNYTSGRMRRLQLVMDDSNTINRGTNERTKDV